MSAGDRATVYTFGQWEVDLGRRELRAGGNAVRIGSRAFAIIEVLVRAGGQLVSGDALMSFVWPGISVADNTLQVHISAVRKALGSDRGLLRTTSGRGYRLVGPWVAQGADAAPDIAADAAPVVSGLTSGNLPVATSDLIGRAAAVQYVRDLLSAYRIVTLTGAGGAGKTRLALEVVRHELAHFEGGGWWSLPRCRPPTWSRRWLQRCWGLNWAATKPRRWRWRGRSASGPWCCCWTTAST
jgi:DNA-binding winged helix-turn-helix (wHTH) protein